MAPCSRGPTLLLWFCRLATLSHNVNHRTSPIQGPADRFQVWVPLRDVLVSWPVCQYSVHLSLFFADLRIERN